MSTKSPAEFLRHLDQTMGADSRSVVAVHRLLPALADVVREVETIVADIDGIPDTIDLCEAYYRLAAAVAELEGKA